MQSLIFRQALEQIRQRLNVLMQTTPNGNILLGIAGQVASGKSRLYQILYPDIEILLHRNVIYLPFDLWINEATVCSSTNYAGKFLIDDFIEALKCIHTRERFLVPRYDIIKIAGVQKGGDQVSTQQIIWNNKNFIKSSSNYQMQVLPGSTDLYIEAKSGYIYSLFPSISDATFVVDGTLVFSKSAIDLYNYRIFVQASWPLRVARMIRRFNRKEVFGTTSSTINDYVSFLVDEARSCADEEIYKQSNENMLVVESIPDTLSNYLDLVYLRWYMQQVNTPQWVTIEEIEIAMKTFLQSLKDEHDTKILKQYQYELFALIESKHLLAINDIDKFLTELVTIIL